MVDKSKTSKLTPSQKLKLSKVWVQKNGTGAFTTHSKPSTRENV